MPRIPLRVVIGLSVLLLAAAGCGDDDGGNPTDAPVGGGADGAVVADGAPGPDGAGTPGIDAAGGIDGNGTPVACQSAETLEECIGNPECVAGCAGMCDCTCPGPSGHEGCGCADCDMSCFLFETCEPRSGYTACGDEGLFCDTATEICVLNRAFFVTPHCAPVPPACDTTRTCGCAGSTVCIDPFTICNDVDDNVLACDCPTC